LKPPLSAKRLESGQALLLVIVSMSLFLLGALGFAIDGAQLYAQRQMAQTAADAAAQAGIMSIFSGTNATAPNPFATESPPSSFTCTTTDGRTPCVYGKLNGFGGTADDTVTITFPTTVSGVPLSPIAPIPAIAVTVQRNVKGGLIQLLGPSVTVIRARATAGISGTVPSTCVYTLDASASGAFTASNGAIVTMDCGIAVKSSSSSGGVIKGSARVTASSIAGKFALSGGGWSSVTPSGAASTAADPYASVPAPAVDSSCDAAHTNYSRGSGNWTLDPDTFCGGITISNGGTAIFHQGTYVIKGGALNLGYSTITGDGVMFYLTGTNANYGSVSIGNGADVTFTPPVSGVYTGLLFFQDRAITSSVNAAFAGGVTLKLTGGLYFPTTTVSYQNGSSSDGYSVAIVSKKVSFTGGEDITFDPTGIKTGLAVKSVALIE
jgi:hypothetical protein